MQAENENNRSELDLFGERLKLARELIGLSQLELANAVGQKGYQTISRYERNERFPDTSTMDLLARNLNVAVEWLVSGFVNENYSFEINATKMIDPKITTMQLAINMGVPVQFIEAIEQNKITPSKNFYIEMFRTIGIKTSGNVKELVLKHIELQNTSESKVKFLQFRVDKLEREAGDFQEFIEKLFSENEKLRAENAELKKKLE